MNKCFPGLILAWLPLLALAADEKTTVAPGTPVTITVSPAAPAAPPVSINLFARHGHVVPCKGKCDHTGGGNIDVAQPTSDALVVTMTGVAVANGGQDFDLDQCFEVSFDNPKVKKAKLTVEGRVIGLLRGEKKGSAEYGSACATVGADGVEVVTLCVEPHSVCACQSLSVNDHDGPKSLPIAAGKYTLHQTFHIAAHSGSYLCKRPSAEFAPDPALDPLWISYYEPFHGAIKKDFGFQVTIKVAEDADSAAAEK